MENSQRNDGKIIGKSRKNHRVNIENHGKIMKKS